MRDNHKTKPVKDNHKVKPGDLASMLKEVDRIDGGFTGRTSPQIDKAEAERMMADACRRFLGIKGDEP